MTDSHELSPNVAEELTRSYLLLPPANAPTFETPDQKSIRLHSIMFEPNSQSGANLLALLADIRYEIYDYVLPKLPKMPATYHGKLRLSSTHRHPPASLLLIHPLLRTEILDHHFRVARYTIEILHDVFDVDCNEFVTLLTSDVLLRIRHLHLEMSLVKDVVQHPGQTDESLCAEIRIKTLVLCEVLALSRNLKRVTIAWGDFMPTCGLEAKLQVLEPLSLLPREVEIELGKVCCQATRRNRHDVFALLTEAVAKLGHGRLSCPMTYQSYSTSSDAVQEWALRSTAIPRMGRRQRK